KYNSSGEKILIRAHGEPPETYRILQEQNLSVIDGTCPIVRRSQLLARSYFEKGYLVILVGKKGHPEIIGINGYCENKTLVIETPEEVDTIPSGKKLFVMAQTTAHPETHTKIIEKIRKKGHAFESKNTICKYIINREAEFVEFIRECDIVLVVGGKNSSNTGVLYKNALREQKQTYRIEKPEELDFNWFKFQDTVGITGGTSTPPRLIEQVKKILEVKFNSSVSSVKRPIRS
ncbi:MAG: 4-hydroxy-3-methylbut-2-enyl diphosphate reductase, partial [Calditrichaeota bacterium]